MLQSILTHAEPTGFAPSGECLALKIVFPDPQEKAQAQEAMKNPSQKINKDGQVVIEVMEEVEVLDDVAL